MSQAICITTVGQVLQFVQYFIFAKWMRSGIYSEFCCICYHIIMYLLYQNIEIYSSFCTIKIAKCSIESLPYWSMEYAQKNTATYSIASLPYWSMEYTCPINKEARIQLLMSTGIRPHDALPQLQKNTAICSIASLPYWSMEYTRPLSKEARIQLLMSMGKIKVLLQGYTDE